MTTLRRNWKLTVSALVGGALVAAAAAPKALSARTTPAKALAHIRGQVFDSLTMSRVASALVWVPGTTRSGFTDSNGHFDLDSVPTGKQFISFSSTGIDSLGLGTLGASVDVAADGIGNLTLATPSFKTIWRALCTGTPGPVADSGIVWGTVREAKSDTRLSGAGTRFQWVDMTVGSDKKVAMNAVNRNFRTDSTGTYYACGLPPDVPVSFEAEGAQSASGVLESLIGERRLLRVDLLVSTDMVAPPAKRTPEEIAALKPHGSATVHGTVRNDKGVVQGRASVTFAAVDTVVTTDADGQFVIANLPSGTHQIEARQVGSEPARAIIDLHPGKTTEVDLQMATANQLATVNVRASAESHADHDAVEERRKSGFGVVIDPADIVKHSDMTNLLQGLNGVTVARVRGVALVTMPLGSLTSGPCRPLIWIDGHRGTMEELALVPLANLRAVEVYNRAGSAPPMYVGLQACGVILFWTNLSRW